MDEKPEPEQAPAAPESNVSLKMTDDQRRALLQFTSDELAECEKQMGRGKDGITVAGSWLDKRRLNQLWYEGDLEWRTNDAYLGGVFNDSNFTRGDGKRYVRHMAAKASDDMLGTSPCFAALKKDTSNQNAALTKAIEDYTQDAFDKSNVPDVLREAIELALVRNEAVVKVRHAYQLTAYVGPATVLVDETGEPVATPTKRLYIYKNDDLLPMPDQPGVLGLEKDASFTVSEEQAATFRYQYFEDLPQVQVQHEGLEARVLDPRDFITRLKVDCIHDAPLCAHYYDESPVALKATYGADVAGGGYFSASDSGEKSPVESQGEQRDGQATQQWVNVAEVYVRFDADGDGLEEEILLIVDRQNIMGPPIFCDYLHKVMKKRPFEVIHGLRKVPNRWYGIGIYTDKFDNLVFVDKTFNRINLKNSKACTVTAAKRKMIQEWSDMKMPIVLGGDEVLTLDDKWTESDGSFLQQVRLIEVSAEEVELMQQMLQAMDQEFGYISAADASATGLNQSKTATGIASIERSGNNIVKAVERIQARGITSVLEQAVEIVLENADPTRLMLSKQAELLSLNREEIRDMPREVKLLLTRSRSSELLQTNEAATVKANEYWTLLETNPRRAKFMRPMYLNQLKALEQMDADDILPEVTDEDIAAFAQAQQAAQQPQKPPSESISVKMDDLVGTEREQALAKFGIQADPEALAEKQAQTIRVEAAKHLQKKEPAKEQDDD